MKNNRKARKNLKMFSRQMERVANIIWIGVTRMNLMKEEFIKKHSRDTAIRNQQTQTVGTRSSGDPK